MGEVFKALDMELERHVAIKCVRPEISDLEEAAARFRNEARTLARLSHPNIATVFRFFREDDRLFLVMEYIDGEPFGNRLQKGALSPSEAVWMVREALHGLSYAHQNNVVHRDIKPGNLMLSQERTVKVLDFGIAHLVGGTRLTRAGGVVGTPAYMAPEQILGKDVDPRTDLYSLGIVLYELLSGALPYGGNSDFEMMRSHIEETPRPLEELTGRAIPTEVQAAVQKALSKDTTDRFQTAEEFDKALDLALPDDDDETIRNTIILSPPSSEPVEPSEPTPLGDLLQPVATEIRRRVRPAQIGVGVVLALLVGAVAWAVFVPGSGPTTTTQVASTSSPIAMEATEANEPLAVTTAPIGLPAADEEPEPQPPAQQIVQPQVVQPQQVVQQQPVKQVQPANPAPRRAQPAVARPAPIKPKPAPGSGAVVRSVKVSVHEKQRTGHFSRNAGYNGAFTLSGTNRSLQIDEIVDIYQAGSLLRSQPVTSASRRPGKFKTKQRIPDLKTLAPGSYELRLRFVANGRTLGTHKWQLQVN